MTTSSTSTAGGLARSRSGARILRITLAALAVALSAQVIVPLPFTPIPFTLQPLAVLAVGGLFGAGEGAMALVLYLAVGLLGLPVFAGGGSGIVRLIGPTGGYLLAFPVAAAITGALTTRRDGRFASLGRIVLGCVVGMAVIHIGGTAQLALLGGDPALAYRQGFLPFFTGDLIKVGLAAAIVLLAGPRVRPAA